MNVKANYQELTSPQQTAREMVRLATQYAGDLGEKSKWNLPRFYSYVRSLEFRPDPLHVEHVARPALSMRHDWPHRDCDDKAVLFGAWCYANGIPFRFVASSSRGDKQLHHVYTLARINGKEVVIDGTYPKNKLGAENSYTRREFLTGEIMNQMLATMEGYPPELGSVSSILRKTKNVAKKAGKVTVKAAKMAAKPTAQITHTILRTPGLKDAIAAAIPGGSAALQAARAAYKKGTATGETSSLTDSYAVTDSSTATPGGVPRWVKPAALLAVGGAVLYFATRNKK